MKILILYKKDGLLDSVVEGLCAWFSAMGTQCDTISGGFSQDTVQLLARRGYDSVVVFQLETLNKLAAAKKKQLLTFKTVYVCCEYTCPTRFAKDCCDVCVTAHESLVLDFVNRGIPREKIQSFGVPVCAPKSNTEKSTARAALGLSNERELLVFVCAGLSSSQLVSAATDAVRLCSKDFNHIFLCSESRSRDRAAYKLSSLENVYVEALPTDLSLYFAACDCAVCTPQGVLLSQAALCRVPLIIFNSSRRRCADNTDFFTSRSMAFCGKSVTDGISHARRVCRLSRLRENMTDAQQKNIPDDAVQSMCKFIADNA